MTKIEDLLKRSDFNLFLKEVKARWNEDSPKFFRVLGDYSLVLLAIGFIPEFLDALDIVLPPKWATIVGYLVKGAGAMGKFVASMPVKQPTTEIMPFTEKKNIQKALNSEEAAP